MGEIKNTLLNLKERYAQNGNIHGTRIVLHLIDHLKKVNHCYGYEDPGLDSDQFNKLSPQEKELVDLLLEHKGEVVQYLVVHKTIWPDLPACRNRLSRLKTRCNDKLKPSGYEIVVDHGWGLKIVHFSSFA